MDPMGYGIFYHETKNAGKYTNKIDGMGTHGLRWYDPWWIQVFSCNAKGLNIHHIIFSRKESLDNSQWDIWKTRMFGLPSDKLT